MVEDTTQYSEQSFLRSYYIPKSDESNGQMCYIQGRLMMRKYFSHPLFGVYLIFLFFLSILKRIKEYYVIVEERAQQTYKLKAQGQD
jgi:hypothetical protein